MKRDAWMLAMFLLVNTGFMSLNMQLGLKFGRDEVREQAIQAGVAEWSIDPATGAKSFRFRSNER